MPKKPTKWGLQMFVRSGTSGMTYDILPYDGANTFDDIVLPNKRQNLTSQVNSYLPWLKQLMLNNQLSVSKTILHHWNCSTI